MAYIRYSTYAVAPKNPSLEPNTWSGSDAPSARFAFKLYCVLETGIRGRARLSKAAHTTLYSSSSIYSASTYYRFLDIAAYWSKIATPMYLAPPLGVEPSDLRNDPW